MTATNCVQQHAELVARITSGLCTRTLNHFAEEARLDGESLKDAVERYEIDYAWQVLGSERLRDACLATLEARFGQPVTDEQKTGVAEILKRAAAEQAPDLLMSFDNDVPEQLASALRPWFEPQAAPALMRD